MVAIVFILIGGLTGALTSQLFHSVQRASC